MEAYRLSSKIRDDHHEYLIQTTNGGGATVQTTIFVDGVPAESTAIPHPLESNPEDILSFVKLTHDEKKSEIEALLKACRELDLTGDFKMMFHLATAFYYKGFYRNARDLFQAATVVDQEYHQAFNGLGLAELALGNIPSAVEACAQAVRLRPGYPDYRNNYAEALLAAKQPGAAVEQLQEALNINMYYSDAYFNLGMAKLQSLIDGPRPDTFNEQLAAIRDLFHRATLTHSSLQGDSFDRGMDALKESDLLRAFALMQRVREEKKELHRREFASFYMRFVLHPELITEKALQERIRFLEKELRNNPTYVDLHAELAVCFLEQARLAWGKGLDRLKHTVELNPSLKHLDEGLDRGREVSGLMENVFKCVSEKE